MPYICSPEKACELLNEKPIFGMTDFMAYFKLYGKLALEVPHYGHFIDKNNYFSNDYLYGKRCNKKIISMIDQIIKELKRIK